MATNDKYDRQLRMWGNDGQKRLNSSSVLCLGLSPAGTEALKNLVLPGIGSIHIVSNRKVSQRDLAQNFFVDVEAIGHDLSEVSLVKSRLC